MKPSLATKITVAICVLIGLTIAIIGVVKISKAYKRNYSGYYSSNHGAFENSHDTEFLA